MGREVMDLYVQLRPSLFNDNLCARPADVQDYLLRHTILAASTGHEVHPVICREHRDGTSVIYIHVL